ncbi:MAG: hypothetical protein KAS23_16830 [Anaerohalosphaera sp.]|nr:hypothetical protein [Anaerohalosphaera sp.]
MTENAKPGSIVDTTDCFEAISTFKSTKNFLFLIILLTLLTLQATFWMNRFGCIDKGSCQGDDCASQSCQLLPQQDENADDATESLTPLPAETVTDPVHQADDIDENKIVEQAQQQIEQGAVQPDPEAETQPAQPETVAPESSISKVELLKKLKPKICCITLVIKLCNCLLIFASVLYSLILLMSIKVSITGRMGGITHISKAFIFSLYAIIFMLPWQQIFPGILIGAIYTPSELFNCWDITADTSVPMTVLFYLRFTGLWLIVFLMLFCAQLRSIKWAKTILRRLGMVY